MNTQVIQSSLQAVTKRNDIILAVFLLAIIFMMVLPLPTLLVDTLIAINITLAIILLMISVYIKSPLAFSAFPAVLLISTLFRLALSITTTRLILLDADAGNIITTFGKFVVGGNVVVGIVVFSIITIVQFVVITKGSERVAEVAARFSLDGMPGKQMSIDSDMRGGVIDGQEARRRRQLLEKESQLYGSMDGAMKFVKGDAIAGIFIILINIIGGISIGSLQQDMDLGEAGHIYTILTVGDGLVAQIPALFIAITSGIIVTRVSTEESGNLGQDIGSQLLAQPKALLIGSGALLAFSMVPGFPTAIFLLLGILTAGVGFTLQRIDKRNSDLEGAFMEAVAESAKESVSANPMEGLATAAPLSVDICESLNSFFKHELMNRELSEVRNSLYTDLGIPFPGVHLRYKPRNKNESYEIRLHEVPVAEGEVRPGYLFVQDSEERLKMLNIPYEAANDFISQIPSVWVHHTYKHPLIEANIPFLNGYQVLAYHVSFVLQRHADEFIGTQETSQLLDQLLPKYPELVKEVRGVVPTQTIGGVLKRLVSEGISVHNLRSICETVLRFGKDEKDPSVLTEFVRADLRRQISHKFSNENNVLIAVLLDPQVEELVRNSIENSPAGDYLALAPDISQNLVDQIRAAFDDVAKHDSPPVLIAAQDIRRFVRVLLDPYIHRIPVLSYHELTPEVSIQPVNRIHL